MKISLVVVNGKPMSGAEAKPSQEIPVKTNKYVIGRDPRCHLRPNNCHVSNFHCALVVGNRSLVLKDLGSEHGTYVNGERITKTALKDGDQIRVAKLVFGVKVMADPLVPRKPKKKGQSEPLPASPPPSPKSGVAIEVAPAPAPIPAAKQSAKPAAKPAPKPAPAPAAEEDDIFGGGVGNAGDAGGGFSGIMANFLDDDVEDDDDWDDEPSAPAAKSEPAPKAAKPDPVESEFEDLATMDTDSISSKDSVGDELEDFDFDSIELDQFESPKKEEPKKPAAKPAAPPAAEQAKPAPAAKNPSKEAKKPAETKSKEAPKPAADEEEDIFAAPDNSKEGGTSTGFSMVMADFLLEEEEEDDDEDF